MKLSYIGHACFLVESDAGVRVLMDPYQPGAFGGAIGLKPFLEKVDCITSSHDHLDHYHMDAAFGDPAVLRHAGVACGIRFDAIELPHGTPDGASRGQVRAFRYEMDGVVVFHPGDTGRVLSPAELKAVGRVDVLMVPVGGHFTIGPTEATAMIRQLNPAIAIPMHFQSAAIQLPIAPLPVFLREWGTWDKAERQPVVITPNTLPEPTQVLVLDATHALR